MLRTIINKNTGKVYRAQFHDLVSNDEMIIDVLRTEDMENPYWDFENNLFYNKELPENLVKE